MSHPRRIAFTAVAAAALVGAGCGGSGASSSDKADETVKDWLKAGTEKDGKKFCELMTVDYLERTTGAQSDAAKKKCESDVKAGSGNYPVKFDVQKPTKTTDNTAEVAVKSMAPNGTVKLKKEDGKFRIDDVK